MPPLRALLVIALVQSTAFAQQPAARRPEEVVVVINEQSPTSKTIGNDYAHKRHVPHILRVRCPDSALNDDNETIAFADYRKAIERPVAAFLQSHAEVQFVVLTKGVPIRIYGAETGVRPDDSPATTPLDASVDSTLAALGYTSLPGAAKIRITGSGGTGVAWVNRYWNAKTPFSHQTSGGYLVTRLDGYTQAQALALTARSLAADGHPPTGPILLDTQPDFGLGEKEKAPFPVPADMIREESPYDQYNADMVHAGEALQARRVPVELDLKPVFVGNRKGLGGYFSWGSNDGHFEARAYAGLSFAAGSLGDTAVSTSARTFLHTEGGQSLIADLTANGLTCAKGYTDEPLLQAIASPTIALDRYTTGYTMAESLWAASHFVGWQDIVLGDPLCAPYRE